MSALGIAVTHRPRLLVRGAAGGAQSFVSHALLRMMEFLPIHSLDVPTIMSGTFGRSPAESVYSAVTEAWRRSPSILFSPDLHLWAAEAASGAVDVFVNAVGVIPPDAAVFILATSDGDLPEALESFFGSDEVVELADPTLVRV
jgi:ATPase family AAA domain-containing protein 2